MGKFFVRGDIGKHFSYSFTAGAGLLRYPQTYLGSAPAYYQGFVPSDNASINRDIPAYKQDAYFPWTENVIWIGRAQMFGDDFMTAGGDTLGLPRRLGGSLYMMPEISGDFF